MDVWLSYPKRMNEWNWCIMRGNYQDSNDSMPSPADDAADHSS